MTAETKVFTISISPQANIVHMKQCNLVYGLTCVAPDCGESYVGETKQSLKARLNQHRRPSTNEAQNWAVYKHCKASNHSGSFKPGEAVILDKEARWFERGVREAIWERIEQPALKKEGASVFSCRTHGMKRSEGFPAVYHVTNQKPDEVWSFQTQRSKVSCKFSVPAFDFFLYQCKIFVANFKNYHLSSIQLIRNQKQIIGLESYKSPLRHHHLITAISNNSPASTEGNMVKVSCKATDTIGWQLTYYPMEFPRYGKRLSCSDLSIPR